MRRFIQFCIFFINVLIICYFLPISVIKNQKYDYLIFILIYTLIMRFYILWEIKNFPAKMYKFISKKEVYLTLLIPLIGPTFCQFIYTKPVFKSKRKVIDANFGYDSMTYFNNGISFFNELYEEIDAAQEEIILYYYIVKNDDLVKEFTNLIIKKHKQNVKIQIKVDAFGVVEAYKSFYLKLKKQGIDIKIVLPYKKWAANNIMSYRSHKKFVIIDQKICYLGGMNLAKEYLGFSAKYGNWEDYMIKYNSNHLAKILKTDFLDKSFINLKYPKKSRLIIENSKIKETKIYDLFMKKIKFAKKEITIVTPYVSLTPKMFELLKQKSKEVKITFIVPGKTDGKFFASSVLKSTLSKLKNIEIREVENSFVHTKLYFFDNEVILGSINFDMRSFFINDEILVHTKLNSKFLEEKKRLINISNVKVYKEFNSIYSLFKNAM